MLAISLCEFLATGNPSTRWFHGLVGGNSGQPDAPESEWADTSAGIATSAAHARTRTTRRTKPPPAARLALRRTRLARLGRCSRRRLGGGGRDRPATGPRNAP